MVAPILRPGALQLEIRHQPGPLAQPSMLTLGNPQAGQLQVLTIGGMTTRLKLASEQLAAMLCARPDAEPKHAAQLALTALAMADALQLAELSCPPPPELAYDRK